MRSNRRGFTLVELMATVGILATLSSIALPKFGEMIETSNERYDKQILRRVRLGIQMYYDDNDYFPPDISATESASGPGPHAIKDYFQPYYDTGDHHFPLPKSRLNPAPPWSAGCVYDAGPAPNGQNWIPGLTNSNYHVVNGWNSPLYGYNSATGAFIFCSIVRDHSVYWFGGASEGAYFPTAAPGVPKCVWGSDRDPGRDSR